jgi:hypothetical protein
VALSTQLPPDLARPIHAEILVIDALDRRTEAVVAPGLTFKQERLERTRIVPVLGHVMCDDGGRNRSLTMMAVDNHKAPRPTRVGISRNISRRFPRAADSPTFLAAPSCCLAAFAWESSLRHWR